ncbi:2,3-bisphosphoglycerate-independent phosphoglycerate mutase [Paenibacillus radicis (ex Xue et al. 2023)]|uniref:2,3-bisphosphoglycerate-independent phosphoglycerate mutase n=1 Tax=Paenibacillus radicis (ex Xue et al. 2023) TaxID=2972489 RepID=A0ABT1YM44_9BACL|nr:2,3-bisphosphoglycerate-independent phosphoglycerate mutase [Paenibacillus radicis (ex Xue et al. 2023)]MCR8633815.1 2,3-bisphosphoglycerate-independent phosphoglycerate mutase [Paenibacillus radicis (ex Xue et al. 2023)]
MLYRKAIVAIADGLGDRPHPLLDNRTPLEYAKTPNLDRLASKGITGMMDLISSGIPVGTDMGHLILFGYQPHHYPGRGPIEALGIGMDVKPGDIVLRCNFATVDEDGIVVDRRAGRIRENTNEIAQAIDGMELEDGVVAYVKPATEHRAVLILRGNGLSDKVSDSDPKAPNDGKPYCRIKPLDTSDEAGRTAILLNLFLKKVHAILSAHPINQERIEQGKLPANFILTRGAGQVTQLEPIVQQLNFRGSCIAGESTVLGVAQLAGFKTVTDIRMTGNIDTDIELKARLAIEEIADNDMVYVHFKAPDIKGHDNEPFEKARAIELFDRMVGLILQQLPENVYLALAADHSTPCEVGEHTGEPVPVLIYGPSIRRDRVQQYNELDCAYGGLGHLSGNEFVTTLHGLMGYVKKQGN